MSKLATIKTPAGPVRLSGKGRKAFDTLCLTGGCVRLAALDSKLSERQVRRLLAKPGMRELMHQRARDTMALAAPMAADRVRALAMQDETRKVSLDASLAILQTNNIRPPPGHGPSVSLNIIPRGYIIDLSDDGYDEAGRPLIERKPAPGGEAA
jgi:hypothetical protein